MIYRGLFCNTRKVLCEHSVCLAVCVHSFCRSRMHSCMRSCILWLRTSVIILHVRVNAQARTPTRTHSNLSRYNTFNHYNFQSIVLTFYSINYMSKDTICCVRCVAPWMWITITVDAALLQFHLQAVCGSDDPASVQNASSTHVASSSLNETHLPRPQVLLRFGAVDD